MLVHLKPRRSLRKNEIMENYTHTANWTYNNSNAIHCKKNIKSSKVEKILTDRVSANGKSLSPIHGNNQTIQLQSQQEMEERDMKLIGILEAQKAKVENMKKSTVVQLSTIYKKTFKYNTTMYQILKNLTKNNDSKTKKTRKSQQVQHEQEKNYSTERLKSNDGYSSYNLSACGRTSNKLQILQNIKRQCSLLEVQDKVSACHVNQLNLNVIKEQGAMIKTTFLQWRSNKPHLTKLNWRKEPRNKPAFKSNSILSPKFNYKTSETEQKDDMLPLHQSHIDTLFSSYQSYQGNKNRGQKSISPRKTEPLQRISEQFTRVPKSERKEKLHVNEPGYRIIRNKQFSYRIGHVQNTEFSVDAWNTKERQWEDTNPSFV